MQNKPDTETLWRTYIGDLTRFVHSKVVDKDIASDIVQDCFLKAHQQVHQLKDPKKAKSWLFSIARNRITDHFRTSNSVPLTSPETNEQEPTVDHKHEDCLEGIIKNISAPYQQPLYLSVIKGLKQQEIAKALKRPLPTIKSQLQRGRKLIAKGYMDCCGFVENKEGFLVGELKNSEDCKICS